MSMEDIKRDFPSLNQVNHEENSDADFNYNCLAFVLGDCSNRWEPPAQWGYYWPPGFPEDVSVPTVTEIIKLHGFVVELSPEAKPVADSIAIYAKAEEWTHFAKFSGGIWTSKIGETMTSDIPHRRYSRESCMVKLLRSLAGGNEASPVSQRTGVTQTPNGSIMQSARSCPADSQSESSASGAGSDFYAILLT